MNIYLKYLVRLLKHKYFVFIAGSMIGLPLWLRITHDWTKFLPCEFIPYAKNFCGDYSRSPVGRENANNEFLKAWLHHENSNKHHWGYWVPRSGKSANEPLEIPDVYLLEMIADFMGASRTYTGKWSISRWLGDNIQTMKFNKNTKKNFLEIMHEATFRVFCLIGEQE